MGKEAEVRAVLAEGTEDAGRLRYEPPRLIFRGAVRRVFEGAALEGVEAIGCDLALADGTRFVLGERAARRWAETILQPKSRLDKLGVKAEPRVAILNLDDPEFAGELAGRCPLIDASEGSLDLLFYGADSADDLARIASLVPLLADRGALWVVSLKGKLLKVKDTEVMAAAKAAGLVDSKVVAFSDTRTALKFTRRR
jgi:hypothetical protein